MQPLNRLHLRQMENNSPPRKKTVFRRNHIWRPLAGGMRKSYLSRDTGKGWGRRKDPNRFSFKLGVYLRGEKGLRRWYRDPTVVWEGSQVVLTG